MTKSWYPFLTKMIEKKIHFRDIQRIWCQGIMIFYGKNILCWKEVARICRRNYKNILLNVSFSSCIVSTFSFYHFQIFSRIMSSIMYIRQKVNYFFQNFPRYTNCRRVNINVVSTQAYAYKLCSGYNLGCCQSMLCITILLWLFLYHNIILTNNLHIFKARSIIILNPFFMQFIWSSYHAAIFCGWVFSQYLAKMFIFLCR